MRISLTTASLPLVLTSLCAAQPGIHPEELKLKPKIDAAIDKGVQALIDTQHRNGSWGEYPGYVHGKTAMCAYALLKCGVSPDSPTLRRAFARLDSHEPYKTYTTACMMLAYGATGRAEYHDRLEDLLKRLLDWDLGGQWGYPRHGADNNGASRPDLSNSQYAALGLWIAHKAGIKVPSGAWIDLARITLKYQEKPRDIKDTSSADKKGTGSKAGKLTVAGFGYERRRKATGSMTAAGIAILKICEIGLGKRLKGKLRRQIADGIEHGANWLGHEFKIDTNPHKGNHHYYYLYGLERTGSLLRQEQFGKHWWYLQGAKWLLKQQGKDGHWFEKKGHAGGARAPIDTCFALLFLRRATASGPTTGDAKTANAGFAVKKDSKIALRGAGQSPVALWIDGFHETIQKRHEELGIRVLRVEYLLGDRVLGIAAGDPMKPWRDDTFLHRCENLPLGKHVIHTRATLVSPEVPPGETTSTETVESERMTVNIQDVFRPWMVEAAKLGAGDDNLVRRRKPMATASSNASEAGKAVDGKEQTSWLCGANDKEPTITIELPRAVNANRLQLTQAGFRNVDIDKYDRIVRVAVAFNKDKGFQEVPMHPDYLGVTTHVFESTRKIKKIHVRVLERESGKKPRRSGFSEIVLRKTKK